MVRAGNTNDGKQRQNVKGDDGPALCGLRVPARPQVTRLALPLSAAASRNPGSDGESFPGLA